MIWESSKTIFHQVGTRWDRVNPGRSCPGEDEVESCSKDDPFTRVVTRWDRVNPAKSRFGEDEVESVSRSPRDPTRIVSR
jgi:hypothetical protein